MLRVLQEREVERVGARKPIGSGHSRRRDHSTGTWLAKWRRGVSVKTLLSPLGVSTGLAPIARAHRRHPATGQSAATAKHVNKMKHAAARLSPEAQACLVGYPWPGNVRELDNAIQRALILQQGGLIQPQDFCLTGPVAYVPLPTSAPVQVRVADAEAESAGALGDDLRRREFQMIIDTLRAERGRRKEAAPNAWVISRAPLRYKLAQMRDAGMDVEAYLFAT